MLKGLFANTRAKGMHYEQLAEQYLQAQGLRAVARNYICKYGEIDLIMEDQNTLVFVEVKYRKSQSYGGAIAALSPSKLQKLQRSIYHYLECKKLKNLPIRIDFIAIEGVSSDNIKWIKNIY
ncbi:YraN family protein [Pseudoalteromonas sp. MTN2-4]|uniref:YraN family protein n=1 Tax=Pseudoalteromonas sp. MTN2-4 TaxID=3056555 RepID=UPI0036F36509